MLVITALAVTLMTYSIKLFLKAYGMHQIVKRYFGLDIAAFHHLLLVSYDDVMLMKFLWIKNTVQNLSMLYDEQQNYKIDLVVFIVFLEHKGLR